MSAPPEGFNSDCPRWFRRSYTEGVETPAPPTCRRCGRALILNTRGAYVDCCSRYVTPPVRRNPTRAALATWSRALERLFFALASTVGASAAGRAAAIMIAVLVGLACLIVSCTALF